MERFNPTDYGPMFSALLAIDRRRPLNEGTPDRAATEQLQGLSTETAFSHARIVDRDMAACCISGVWLLHDFLDESHAISQGIDTTSGSYWHAIMHRREGDFSNAKYWFRRVGAHPALDHVAVSLGSPELVEGRDAKLDAKALRSEDSAHFDPFAFVDLCESAVRGKSDARDTCLDIQQIEWERLFDYCYRCAVGRS
jgi:hypothetical protein